MNFKSLLSLVRKCFGRPDRRSDPQAAEIATACQRPAVVDGARLDESAAPVHTLDARAATVLEASAEAPTCPPAPSPTRAIYGRWEGLASRCAMPPGHSFDDIPEHGTGRGGDKPAGKRSGRPRILEMFAAKSKRR